LVFVLSHFEHMGRCRRLWPAAFLAASVVLTGCAGGNAPLVDILSAVAAGRLGSNAGASIPDRPNPAYSYLRVELQGRPPALLVLGYVDAHPLGEIEVWYSAQREVIKTQHGRIIATAGLEVDWRAVRFGSQPPTWGAVTAQGQAYQRTRDEMPGYRYAVTERVETMAWTGMPPIGLPAPLLPERARGLTWFRESTLENSTRPLPPSWFATGMHLGRPTVVYSEQCLAPKYCLRLLRWPLQESPS